MTSRGVAQPGSASGLGPEGRRFKSCRPDHSLNTSKASKDKLESLRKLLDPSIFKITFLAN